jgi:glutamate formiminotransferase/formiminotetrahydrofolate cyclodeaminase
VEALELAAEAAAHGNRNSASDAGVAALAALAGAEGAALNVLTNLGSIRDQAFAHACATELDALLTHARDLCAQAQAKVRGTF